MFLDLEVQEDQFHEISEEEEKKSEVKVSIFCFFSQMLLCDVILPFHISFGHIKYKW